MKSTITEAEHLQLIGLSALAKHANKALKELEDAALALLGISEDDRCQGDGNHGSPACDWVGEFLYGSTDLRTALKRIGVKIESRTTQGDSSQ